MRRFLLFLLAASFLSVPTPSWGQALSTDMDNAPAPIGNSRYSLLREPPRVSGQWVRTRTTYLHRPLVLTVASTDPAGRSAAVVEGSLALDVAMGTTLGQDFDVGASLGGHLATWGSGTSIITGDDASTPGIGARDPRLEAGYTWSGGPWRIRPFATLTLPAGSEQNYAGRATGSGELGWVSAWTARKLGALAELSVIIFPQQPPDAVPWNHQLRVGLGARYQVVHSTYLTVETLLQPVVGKLAEGALRPVPAEVLLGAGWGRDGFRLQGATGLGLALSRLPDDVANERPVLAPGTPAVRCSLQLSWEMKHPQ